MMAEKSVRGVVYRCSVCGAELIVVGTAMGAFAPRCCNRAMHVVQRRATFYRCPVCGAELAVVRKGRGLFAPHCCNRPMNPMAA